MTNAAVPIRRGMTGGQFLKAIGPAARSVLARHVLAVYALVHEHHNIQPLGTGTLLAIAGKCFFVTAAHVMNAVRGDRKDELAICLPTEGRLIRIGGESLVTREEDEDVCVVALDAESTERVRTLPMLTLRDTWMSGEQPDCVYLLSGYPREWHRSDEHARRLLMRPYGIAVGRIAGADLALRRYDPKCHLLFTYGLNTLRDDPNGVEAPQSLEGMSGSAIWRIADLPLRAQDWLNSGMRVVAVQTSAYRVGDRAIVRGTKWSVIVAIIEDAFPDLRTAIALHDR